VLQPGYLVEEVDKRVSPSGPLTLRNDFSRWRGVLQGSDRVVGLGSGMLGGEEHPHSRLNLTF